MKSKRLSMCVDMFLGNDNRCLHDDDQNLSNILHFVLLSGQACVFVERNGKNPGRKNTSGFYIMTANQVYLQFLQLVSKAYPA